MELDDWEARVAAAGGMTPRVDPTQLCICGHVDAEHTRHEDGRLLCPTDEEEAHGE
jgi:hypothetical protein